MNEPWTPGPWSNTGGRVWTRSDSGAFFQANYHKDADARLISLAPEMAAWMQEVLDQLTPDKGGSDWPSAWEFGDDWNFDGEKHAEAGRALLARARGENPEVPWTSDS